MSKINASDSACALASRLLRCCFVVAVAVGPICHETVAQPVVKVASTALFTHASDPNWIESVNRLFFIDEVEKRLYGYDMMSEYGNRLRVTPEIKFLVPIAKDGTSFAVGFGLGVGMFPFAKVYYNRPKADNYLEFVPSDEHIECGKAGVDGLLWVGTSCPDGKGKFYAVNDKGQHERKLENIGAPTGLAWSPGSELFYWSDSTKKAIIGCEFIRNETGSFIDPGKEVFSFAANNITGCPGGMTVDVDGHIWIACKDASTLLQIDPVAHSVVQTVTLKGTYSVTSVVFGGANFDELWVTSTGSLFHVTNTSAKGISTFGIDCNWPHADAPYSPS